MKLILLIVIVISSTASFGQADEADIDQIRGWFKATEKRLDNCLMVSFSAEYFDGAFPEIKAWYDKEEKRFIKLSVYASHDWHEYWTDYYVKKDTTPYFTFAKSIEAQDYYTAGEMDMSEEDYYEQGMEAKTLHYGEYRTYFKDTLCIRSLEKGRDFAAEKENVTLSGIKNEETDCDVSAYEMACEYIEMYLKSAEKEMNK